MSSLFLQRANVAVIIGVHNVQQRFVREPANLLLDLPCYRTVDACIKSPVHREIR
jgi:hypothetical protein